MNRSSASSGGGINGPNMASPNPPPVSIIYPAYSNPGLNHTNTLPLHQQFQQQPYPYPYGVIPANNLGGGLNNNGGGIAGMMHAPLQPVNSTGSGNVSRGSAIDPRDLRDQQIFLQQQQQVSKCSTD